MFLRSSKLPSLGILAPVDSDVYERWEQEKIHGPITYFSEALILLIPVCDALKPEARGPGWDNV